MSDVAPQQRTREEIEDLRRDVQRKLDERQGKLGFALKATDATMQEAGWLYIVVLPEGEGVRAYDYAHALTEVEDELRRERDDPHVLLVPAIPD
jgi:hypothetical protein